MCPKFFICGSAAYEDNGTMVLTAEGGLKVTLYLVKQSEDRCRFLNEYYFKTMHHEFAHILHQTKSYDPDYDRISEGLYVSGDWYLESDEALAWFISPYAMSEPREDIAEVTSIISQIRLVLGGTDGAANQGARNHQSEIDDCKITCKQRNIDMDELVTLFSVV